MAEVRFLALDRAGRIDLEELRRVITDGPDLVCVMAANNEIGNIYPVERIAGLAAEAGAAAMVDASQAAGKTRLDVDTWGITYLALSAHKIYGAKGAGALVLSPAVLGWETHGQGTPNVPAIAGFAEACRLRRLEMNSDEPRIAAMRDRLEARLSEAIPNLIVNGDRNARLSGNLHVSVRGVPNGPVLARLHDDVALSSGSACMSGAEAPSHVLLALGWEDELVEGALRIGVGKFTTADEIELAATLIVDAVARVRETMSAMPSGASAAPPN
jgi:cysteine desulfurase